MTQRLVFGLGSLHHIHRRRERQRLIDEAIHAGFDTFDVAPAYGNGLAEYELGDAIRGRGGRVRIHTKVGIPVWIYPRATLGLFPLMRAVDMLTRHHGKAYLRRDFSPTTLKESLHASLRRLRVDHVDTLFLHEPLQPISPSDRTEIAGTLADLVKEGQVGAWGIAGPVRKYWDGSRGAIHHHVQQPLDEWLAMTPSDRSESAILYGVNRAWRAAGMVVPFFEFIRTTLSRNALGRLLVCSTSVRRIVAMAEAVGRD